MNYLRRKQARELAKTAKQSLLIGGAAFVAADLARRAFRHMQLFCPERKAVKSWNPEDYGVPRERVEEQWFETPDGEMLYGWYCRAENPVASAVYCHGNTGNLTTVAETIPYFLEAGCSVLFFDYRGFGRSTGHASIAGIVADGVTAARHHEKIRPRGLPSILYGYSLGGAVAAQVIRHHPFDGLILHSTFTSLPDIARVTWPRLPLHLFAGDFFDTVAVMKKIRVPVLILHGTADDVVPCWMAHTLYDACPAPRRLYTVPGGLHKDLFVRDAPALVSTITQFLHDLPAAGEAPEVDTRYGPVDEIIDSAFRYVRRILRRPLVPKTL
jgi:alpha-beta hydrolase superfamily lysophospholipase